MLQRAPSSPGCLVIGGGLIEGHADRDRDDGGNELEKYSTLPPEIPVTFFITEFVQMC